MPEGSGDQRDGGEMKIAILHGEVPKGAGPDEQDVLAEAAVISEGLIRLGHEPVGVAMSLNLEVTAQTLKRLKPDLVFNIVESLAGTGRLIHIAPALLDALGIPYTGAQTEAMFMTSNKHLAKRLLAGAGLPTPAWFLDAKNPEAPVERGTWIVKSLWEHASVGLDEDSVLLDADQNRLVEEIAHRRKRLGGSCFAEKFIDGREFNISLLASRGGSCSHPEVLPPAEIRFDAYPPGKIRVVGYRAKWLPDSPEYEQTPRSFDFAESDARLLSRLRELSLACWRLFELRGYARVDFRVDSSGKPWILEINANPCLSPDAGFFAATERAKIEWTNVLERIIDDV